MAKPESTREGMVIIYEVATGKQRTRWPVDAQAMVRCGEFSYTPPESGEAVAEVEPPVPAGVRTSETARFPKDRRTDDDGYPEGYGHEKGGAYVELTAPDGTPIASEAPSGKWHGDDAAKAAAWKHWEAANADAVRPTDALR